MNDVTIERCIIDGKHYEDVHGKMLKRYENSVLVDISHSKEFAAVDKNVLNNRIIVPQNAIREKKVINSFEIDAPHSFSRRARTK